ncbi:MAG: OsmC family protein [Bacteroidales bacterium]|jgi:putative redox protein
MGKIDNVSAKWLEEMVFETTVDGHQLLIDSDPSFGGQNKGPKPKPFMLAALAGCTAMDVISILKKMRVVPEKFEVKVEGQLTDEHPKHYERIHVIYEFTGENLPMDKLKRAVDLSENSYCGVMHVYRKALELTSEIVIKT